MTDQATNFERLSRTMHLLQQTLAPFVERELKRTGAGWWTNYVLPSVAPLTREKLPAMPKRGVNGQLEVVPVEDLLALIAKNFASTFRGRLKDPARSYAEELRGHRNLWAHKGAGDIDRASAERAMDTAALLLDDVDPSAAR
nr:Swt1 family HEPN domain-containing protein [Tepidiformaceae bacterium]